MKIVLSCDDLISRDHLTEVFEAFVEIFDEADIYTLVHSEGGIIGPIEMRSIKSSGLTHKVATKEDFGKWSFLVPTAAKHLHIPCSVDLIINLSHGFSHGISKCEKTKQITYLYDFFLESRPARTWREKFFHSYTKHWAEDKLQQADLLLVSSETLKERISSIRDDGEVLNPFFNIDDYPIIPSSTFAYDYYVLNAEGLTRKMAESVTELMQASNRKFCFVGNDEHLQALKQNGNEGRFFGQKCAGEMAPLLAGARGVIDLQGGAFPKLSLSALATGRPVIMGDSHYSRDLKQADGVFGLDGFESQSLTQALDRLDQDYQGFEAKKLRAHAMKFHHIKFKAAIRRKVDNLFA